VVDWARGEATPARSEQQRPAGYPESLQARRRRGIGISAGLFPSFWIVAGAPSREPPLVGHFLTGCPNGFARAQVRKARSPAVVPSRLSSSSRRVLIETLCVLFCVRVGVAICVSDSDGSYDTLCRSSWASSNGQQGTLHPTSSADESSRLVHGMQICPSVSVGFVRVQRD
jgi:hypothetical protein